MFLAYTWCLPVFCVYNSDIEACFIELDNIHTTNVIVGIIYKPPNASSVNFITHFTQILAQVNHDNMKSYMMGDFKINLLNYNSDRTVNFFWMHLLPVLFIQQLTNRRELQILVLL